MYSETSNVSLGSDKRKTPRAHSVLALVAYLAVSGGVLFTASRTVAAARLRAEAVVQSTNRSVNLALSCARPSPR